jgi:hypothetical protein
MLVCNSTREEKVAAFCLYSHTLANAVVMRCYHGGGTHLNPVRSHSTKSTRRLTTLFLPCPRVIEISQDKRDFAEMEIGANML